MSNKRATLASAITAHVEPGMHLNFASTPSRSNAALLHLAAIFRGKNPGFILQATGFHSTAHLLPMLRLGRKYVSCFFGDNFPIPRPNELYTRIAEGAAQLESWSLWSYVSALRAGALGWEWTPSPSLAGTSIGEELQRAGLFRQVTGADGKPLGLLAALRPDVTFVHGLFGDENGNVVFSPPYSEGFWGAHAAKKGVIVTVERIVDSSVIEAERDAVKIATDRVLAVCEAPFGAHPQPLYAMPRFELENYRDDFEHYEKWRALTQDPDAWRRFESEVLDGPIEELTLRYQTWVGVDRLRGLVKRAAEIAGGGAQTRPHMVPPREQALTPVGVFNEPARFNEILLVLAARKIVERVIANGHRTILAGIGHGFLAARMAKLWLWRRGVDVKVMVETGLYDIECGESGNPFLLSYDNIAQARRLSSVEEVLGTLTCGAESSCLGVLGAGQVDPTGAINSTRLAGGKYLTGSGGGHDVAAHAREVIVLTRCAPSRLVEKVDYVTSPGARVSTVVTDLCSFTRADGGWRVGDIYPAHGGKPLTRVLEAIRQACSWPFLPPEDPQFVPLIATSEMMLVHKLDTKGALWEREVRK